MSGLTKIGEGVLSDVLPGVYTDEYSKFSMIQLVTIMSSELQKVVELPPNLKFMVSTFLILTQYKLLKTRLGSVVHQTKTSSHIICLF